jgi:uncharacterized membrane protein YphA (DoxX/SURF4 family)
MAPERFRHVGRSLSRSTAPFRHRIVTAKTKTLTYWASTAILAFVLLSGGLAYLAHQADAEAGMAQLGYPSYLLVIVGVWKLAGGLVVLAPRLPRLKEWAYAGALFDLTGAAASHLARGNDARHVIVPLALAIVALVSWATRPAGRTLRVTP